MNLKRSTMLAPCILLLGCGSEPITSPGPAVEAQVQLSKTAVGGRAGDIGVVYVSSQGLYYDTFVSAETLPPHGRFQQLVPQPNDAPSITEFGPGDPGYLGGRWWVDSNPNGYQDPDDTFLLCPLLPPGRSSP